MHCEDNVEWVQIGPLCYITLTCVQGEGNVEWIQTGPLGHTILTCVHFEGNVEWVQTGPLCHTALTCPTRKEVCRQLTMPVGQYEQV